MRQVIIYHGEDDYWVVEAPSLPGCVSQGKTRQEALENIREAIALYIEELRANGEDVPGDYGPIGVETVSAA
ncbi:MAG: type II toxin-antitoxin system HicB family antitoxin [Anaerolineae bacterium]|nr:type II toxin-antitoxin system HicB family antitoxin [Anaerolineae bacterium]